MIRSFGILLVVLGLVIAVVPAYTECLTGGQMPPMKCHWTARAEIAMGIPLFALGVLLFRSRRAETRRVLGSVGVVLGTMAVLLPTYLIGVCMHPGMTCNTVMKPTLIFAGTLTAAVSLAALALTRDAGETPA